MSNSADCTTGASLQVKKYNTVKYESISISNKKCQILLTVLQVPLYK